MRPQVSIIFVCFCLLFIVDCHHYRGARSKWEIVEIKDHGIEVEFSTRFLWSQSHTNCNEDKLSKKSLIGSEKDKWKCLYGCSSTLSDIRSYCVSYDDEIAETENVFRYMFDYEQLYKIQFGSCCWYSRGNVTKDEFSMSISLILGERSDTKQMNRCPQIHGNNYEYKLVAGVAQVIQINVTDEDGDHVRCRIGENEECGQACSLPSEFYLNQTTCQLHYTPDPANNRTLLFPLAMVVEDHYSDPHLHTIKVGHNMLARDIALSKIPYQLFVTVEAPVAECSPNSIVADVFPERDGRDVRAIVGERLEFQIATKSCGKTELVLDSGPNGIEIHKGHDSLNPLNLTLFDIYWTPTMVFLGSQEFCFRVVDMEKEINRQKCVRIKVDTGKKFCISTSPSQFITFDGVRFSFLGACRYQLITTKLHHSPFNLQHFNLTAGFYVDANGTPSISDVHLVIFQRQIHITAEKQVSIDGEEKFLPVRLPGINIDYNGKFIIFSANNGLNIHLGGKFSFLVELSNDYAGMIEGICGNMNGNTADELDNDKNTETLSTIEKISSFQIDQTCETRPMYEDENCDFTELSRLCSVIANDDCFNECDITPTPFVQGCIESICSNTTGINDVDIHVQSYADLCKLEGFCVCDWREKLSSEMECPPHSHYNSCMKYEDRRCVPAQQKFDYCVEGCECDEGYLLSESNFCVEPHECGMMLHGSYRKPGFTFRTNNCEEVCSCGGGGNDTTECRKAESCGDDERCTGDADGFLQCLQRLPESKVCQTKTVNRKKEIESFDGKSFTTETDCSLLLLRNKMDSILPPIEVYLVKKEGGENEELQVKFDSKTLSLKQGNKFEVNGKPAFAESDFDDFRVRLVGNFLIVSFDFGLVIRWDGEGFQLSGWSPLRHRVEGLCGNFDGNPDNDFSPLGGGGLTSNIDNFVNSWILTQRDVNGLYFPVPEGANLTKICLENERTREKKEEFCTVQLKDAIVPMCKRRNSGEDNCLDIDEATMKTYQSECNFLRDEDGPISTCHIDLDPEVFYQNCIQKFCEYKDNEEMRNTIRDDVLGIYAEECFFVAMSLMPQKDVSFIASDTPGECSSNSIYNECMKPCQPTCQDPNMEVCLEDKDLGDECLSGCQCMEGFFLSNGICVEREECGCSYNGQYFIPGTKFRVKDCKEECECLGNNETNCQPSAPCALLYKCADVTPYTQQCTRRVRKRATCKAYGDPHHLTFDGATFDNMGTCAYVMMKNKEKAGEEAGNFRVVAVNHNPFNGNRNLSSVERVYLHFGDDVIVTLLPGKVVKLNDEEIVDGTETDDFIFQISEADGLVVIETKYNFVVKWDGTNRLRITADRVLREKVEGLCGEYSDDVTDDYVTSSGKLADNVGDFIRSWQVEGYDTEGCVEAADPVATYNMCESELAQIEFGAMCEVLVDENGRFSECHRHVSPIESYQSCLYDLCATNGSALMLETIVKSYETDCKDYMKEEEEEDEHEDMGFINFNPGMGSDFGGFDDCDMNQHYEDEGCNPTCEDLNGTYCENNKVSGCVCDDGYVFSNNDTCIPIEECACRTDDGRYHPRGFQIRNFDCSEVCTCDETNSFNCTAADPCSKLTKCQPDQDGYIGCVTRKRRRATCKGVTDPHYLTFDGQHFDHMGTCSYIMLRNKANYTEANFKVINVNVAGITPQVSHIGEVYIEFGDSHVLHLTDEVKLDGVIINPGYNKSGLEVRKSGLFTLVEWVDIGLVVRWDKMDRLRVTVWDKLKYQVEGLCGSFNDDTDDDMMTSEGEIVSTDDVDKFVDSWIVEGYGALGCLPTFNIGSDFSPTDGDNQTLPGQCDDEAVLFQHQNSCFVIIDPSGPFKDCVEVADPDTAFEDCVYDLCAYNGDKERMERVIASYVDTCREESDDNEDNSTSDTPDCGVYKGETRLHPNNWRVQSNISMPECPPHSHYNSCMSQCQPSCDDVTTKRCLCSPNLIGSQCVEGCQGDEGYFISGNEFVLLEDCGCVADGTYYVDEDTFLTDSCQHRCTCLSGVVSCQPHHCSMECRANTNGKLDCLPYKTKSCQIDGNLHFRTFDERAYDVDGECSFFLVRSSNSDDYIQMKTVINSSIYEIESVKIHLSNQTITLTREEIKAVNSHERNVSDIPYEVFNENSSPLMLRHQGHYVVVSSEQGASVEYDGKRITVRIPMHQSNQVSGLCGDFNGDPKDDLDRDNFIVQDCNIVKNKEDETDTCPGEEEWKKLCGVMTDADGVFSLCVRTLPQSDQKLNFDRCVHDMCKSDGDSAVLLQNLESFVQTCLNNDIWMCDWRDKIDLPDVNASFNCPANSHYDGCASSCPPTCGEHRYDDRCHLTEDCVCDEGYIRSGDSCIEMGMCTCELENGNIIGYNETFRDQNCSQLCLCYGMNKNLCVDNQPCGLDEECKLGDDSCSYTCVPVEKERGTCKVINGQYYTTFDQHHFNLVSSCTYSVVRSTYDAAGPFEITLNHKINNDTRQPQITQVNFMYNGNELQLKPDFQIEINGHPVSPGIEEAGFTVGVTDLYTAVSIPAGISLKWNYDSIFRIDALGDLQGHIEGLCGDFDGDVENDHVVDGVELNGLEFIAHYMIPDNECIPLIDDVTAPDCDLQEARTICSELLSNDQNGDLAKCHNQMDPRQTRKLCEEQWCMTSNVDDIISSYFEDCVSHGFTKIDSPLKPVCPANSEYKICIPRCQPSCWDAEICEQSILFDDTCINACQCNEGFVWNGVECLPESDCSCSTLSCSDGCEIRQNVAVCTCPQGMTMSDDAVTCILEMKKDDEKPTPEPSPKPMVVEEVNNATEPDDSFVPSAGLDFGGIEINSTTNEAENNGTEIIVENEPDDGSYVPSAGLDFSGPESNETENCTETNSFERWNEKLQACLFQISVDEEVKEEVEEEEEVKEETGGKCEYFWTNFYNRDDASGEGDYETLSDLHNEYKDEICKHPIAIEAQLIDGRPAAASGNDIMLAPELGLICMNAHQSTPHCHDFKVRFLCLK